MSMFKDSSSGYGLVTIALHWVCALLIFFLFGLGVYMRGLDYYSPWYHKGPELHIALGILIFTLMVLRLFWRLRGPQPEDIASISKANLAAAKLVKFLLYLGVFVICFSGYLITTAEGDAANFFGIFSIPATLKLTADQVDLAGKIHKYVAWSLVFIAVAHALAALFHHFFKRDKTLVRMLKPAGKSE